MRVRIWQEQKKDILRGFDGLVIHCPNDFCDGDCKVYGEFDDVCDFCVM